MMVNLKEDIKPISYIKTNAADMMRYINDVKNPIIITQNGEARAVLVDIESYQNIKDAFNLLKLLQMSEKEIERGHYRKVDEVFSDIEAELGIQ